MFLCFFFFFLNLKIIAHDHERGKDEHLVGHMIIFLHRVE